MTKIQNNKNNKNKSIYNLEDYDNIEFFQGVPRSLIALINDLGIIQHYYPGENIFNQGLPCNSAYLILNGCVNVFTTSYGGRMFVFEKLKQNDWFNAITCLNFTENNPASVSAESPVKLLSLSCQNFQKLYQNEPLFSLQIMKNISNRTICLANNLEKMVFLPVSGRLADLLINNANKEGVIFWQYTQDDIARRIGTVGEVVGRTLRQFVDEGLIIMHGNNCIVIKDIKSLRQISLC